MSYFNVTAKSLDQPLPNRGLDGHLVRARPELPPRLTVSVHVKCALHTALDTGGHVRADVDQLGTAQQRGVKDGHTFKADAPVPMNDASIYTMLQEYYGDGVTMVCGLIKNLFGA